MRMLASEIAQAAGGQLVGPDLAIDGASTDSRTIRPGQLFIALPGEQQDGHSFIPNAIRAGAGAYITQGSRVGGATAIVVEDSRRALAAAAGAARRHLPDHVLGITGSVGKTSVKDMVTPIVARTGPIAATMRPQDKEVGAPLTLLNADSDTRTIVMEMGARFPGDIEYLCSFASPTVGVITNVGLAQLATFKTLEAIADTEAELVESLPPHGVAVLNVMDDAVFSMKARTRARVLTFGIGAGDVRATEVVIDDTLRPSFRLHTPNGSVTVHMHVHGQHQVINAVAAAASSIALGVSLHDVVAGLEAARLSQWRLELLQANTGATLLNDVYNANPMSVKAALHALARLPVQGRRIAVLGEMAELGDISDEQHAAIGELAHILEIELLTVNAAAYGGTNFTSIEEAAERLESTGSSDAVLVKGSRIAELELLVDRLV